MKPVALLFTLICLCGLTSGITEARTRQATGGGVAGQTDMGPGKVVIRGRSTSSSGSLNRCSGDCQIVTNAVILKADELSYNSDTRTAEAHGNVTIKFIDSAN